MSLHQVQSHTSDAARARPGDQLTYMSTDSLTPKTTTIRYASKQGYGTDDGVILMDQVISVTRFTKA